MSRRPSVCSAGRRSGRWRKASGNMRSAIANTFRNRTSHAFSRHDLVRKPVPTFRDHAVPTLIRAAIACDEALALTHSPQQKILGGRNGMRRIAWLAAASGIGVVVATPPFAENPKLEKPRIALSVGGSVSQMNKIAYFVALNRRYFEQEGLAVDPTNFASGTAALQNLSGGYADVVEGSFEHTLRMQTKGQHLMCITVFGRYPANVLVVRKSEAGRIKTIADLKGRKIGISAPGSSTHN